jgi:hypothetical protein
VQLVRSIASASASAGSSPPNAYSRAIRAYASAPATGTPSGAIEPDRCGGHESRSGRAAAPPRIWNTRCARTSLPACGARASSARYSLSTCVLPNAAVPQKARALSAPVAAAAAAGPASSGACRKQSAIPSAAQLTMMSVCVNSASASWSCHWLGSRRSRWMRLMRE